MPGVFGADAVWGTGREDVAAVPRGLLPCIFGAGAAGNAKRKEVASGQAGPISVAAAADHGRVAARSPGQDYRRGPMPVGARETVGRGTTTSATDRPCGLGRRGVLSLALLLPAIAAIAPRSAQAAPDFTEVAAPIAALNETLEILMKQGRATPFPQRFQTLAPVIDRAFDIETVLRNSVGTHWTTLTDAQRAAVTTAFRRFTIASYVANYDHNSGVRFEISPPLRPLGEDQVLQTTVIPGSGTPIRIDYVMRGSPWKVVDVLLDASISRVAVQRSDFRALINQSGMEGLIASLNRRVAELSHNTLDPQSAG